MCEEYDVDFDLQLAFYYTSLLIRYGREILSIELMDQNILPITEFRQSLQKDYLQEQIKNNLAMNITLKEII